MVSCVRQTGGTRHAVLNRQEIRIRSRRSVARCRRGLCRDRQGRRRQGEGGHSICLLLLRRNEGHQLAARSACDLAIGLQQCMS